MLFFLFLTASTQNKYNLFLKGGENPNKEKNGNRKDSGTKIRKLEVDWPRGDSVFGGDPDLLGPSVNQYRKTAMLLGGCEPCVFGSDPDLQGEQACKIFQAFSEWMDCCRAETFTIEPKNCC